ncbi:MAG: hypothetical protein F4227_06855 [Gammaproteobacteria bacterium]|nr:hypothetical protein [Gammaproteobacteria bacterium]MYF02679.1 hypothetical protein [Gammaproteobacteria bacterium]MYI78243.1 hypothetical protein [Gammaproteobacteria bacterium]
MSELNCKNRTIFLHDNLEILQGLNSRCIDLIYLDPPFNKNKKFTAPIGSSAEGAEFRDIFREEDVKDEWLQTIKEDQPELYQYLNGIKGVGKPYNFAYLAYMAIRLIECWRVLKPTGSIYLHCDPTMSHYLKSTLDCIFGEQNFRNDIVWKRHTSVHGSFQHAPKQWGSITDVLLFYTKSDRFRLAPYRQISASERMKKFKFIDEDTGRRYYDDSAHIWNSPNMGARPNQCYEWRGFKNPYVSGWRLTKQRLEEEYEKGNIVILPNGRLQRRKYEDEFRGTPCGNFWDDILPSSGKERTGYPTQKPLALLKRIINASSNEGDIVLDPFCGCATTCVAAERLNRKWVGVDVSIKAYELVKERLFTEKALLENLSEKDKLASSGVVLKTHPPKRTDVGADYREEKFVYVISHPNYEREYKVGIAKDVNARLNAYQTSDPERQYKLEHSLRTPLFRETEAHIHHHFPNKYEWVQASLDEIKAFATSGVLRSL